MDVYIHILSFVQPYKYLVIFIGSIFEGPIIMLSSGFLYRLGNFDIVPLYLALLSGDLTADFAWYAFGRFAARTLVNKFGGYLGIDSAVIVRIEERFRKYQNKILLISKVTMGFGFALATLIVAGILKVDFKKYLILNIIGGLIWTAFLLTVGYFFGNIYNTTSGSVRLIFIPAVLGLVLISMWFINRFFITKKD